MWRLLNGLAHVIIRDGLHDEAFIAARTEQFDEFAETVRQYPPDRVAAITGIPAADIEAAARMYAQAERAMILYGLGVTEHTDGSYGVMGCANLALLTGNVGKKGAGVNPLRGQNNVQGACDMAALPNVLPGYQSLEDEAVRAKFENGLGLQAADPQGTEVHGGLALRPQQTRPRGLYRRPQPGADRPLQPTRRRGA